LLALKRPFEVWHGGNYYLDWKIKYFWVFSAKFPKSQNGESLQSLKCGGEDGQKKNTRRIFRAMHISHNEM